MRGPFNRAFGAGNRAQRGLSGLAYGISQHEFITTRMEHMGKLHCQLQSIVGDVAIAMIADTLQKIH